MEVLKVIRPDAGEERNSFFDSGALAMPLNFLFRKMYAIGCR
jgi:hypothetical protein